MADPVSVYTARASGLWNTRHEIALEGGEVQGELRLVRGPLGWIGRGEYRPVKGAVMLFQRDPGLVRGQFTMTSESREWIGSSVRFNPFKPVFEINTGGKPYFLAGVPGLGRGWALYAPKTGEVARIAPDLLGRGARIEVLRKTQFPLLLFAYFLGCPIYCETLLPGPSPERMIAR